MTWAAFRNSCDVFSSIFERFVLFWGKLQHNGDQLITLGKPHICPYMGKANRKSRHGFHRPPWFCKTNILCPPVSLLPHKQLNIICPPLFWNACQRVMAFTGTDEYGIPEKKWELLGKASSAVTWCILWTAALFLSTEVCCAQSHLDKREFLFRFCICVFGGPVFVFVTVYLYFFL